MLSQSVTITFDYTVNYYISFTMTFSQNNNGQEKNEIIYIYLS